MAENEITSHWCDRKRKYVLEPGAEFNTIMLPVIQNLAALGYTESDVGSIVGYQGKNLYDWLKNIKSTNPDAKKAWQTGIEMANIELVAQMYKAAVGYDYEEVEQEYKYIQDPSDATKTKKVLIGEKRKVKHRASQPNIAMFMACNRMPEQFSNRIEVTKKGLNIEVGGELSGAQIERLAGKLIEAVKEEKKVLPPKEPVITIDCKVIDNEAADKAVRLAKEAKLDSEQPSCVQGQDGEWKDN